MSELVRIGIRKLNRDSWVTGAGVENLRYVCCFFLLLLVIMQRFVCDRDCGEGVSVSVSVIV